MSFFLSAFFIASFLVILTSKNCQSQSPEEFLFRRDFKSSLNNSDSIKKIKPGNINFQMKKNPWKAVAYSAILPGAGQFYNESYWKIPVIGILGGYFVYELIRNNNKYLDYKTQYENSQTQQNPSGDPQLQTLREFYRDQRDNFIIYSAILYVTNLIDAYVDAQLYDFDVSDKLKIGLLKKNKLLNFSYCF